MPAKAKWERLLRVEDKDVLGRERGIPRKQNPKRDWKANSSSAREPPKTEGTQAVDGESTVYPRKLRPGVLDTKTYPSQDGDCRAPGSVGRARCS